jgi:hypothetical protein
MPIREEGERSEGSKIATGGRSEVSKDLPLRHLPGGSVVNIRAR